MLPIRLETRRYPDGFAIQDQDENPDGPIAVRRSTETEPLIVEAVNLESPIFLRFINSETDDDFLKFLGRFGDDERVSLHKLRMEAQHLAGLAAFSLDEGGTMLMSINHSLRARPLTPVVRWIDGVARLVLLAEKTDAFMALEIATALEAGATMTRCQHCTKRFLFGPFTGRRSHAKFCTDRCRVAAMRLRNASKEAEE